jgi:hypothetical protein
MKSPRVALLLWAGREHLTRPGAALLMMVALGMLTALLATGLLLSHALTSATARFLAEGPDLVVRRVDPQGWRPIALDATRTAIAIPGITDARARIWGMASTPEGAVTVVAGNRATEGILDIDPSLRRPHSGEAVAGRGVVLPPGDDQILLNAAAALRLRVVGRFPAEVDLACHDLVLLDPGDARLLLGLPSDSASDLALYVFHPAEAEALRPELAKAFPWPVQIVTREETRKYYAAAFGRRGGLASLLYLPAALALALLVAVLVRQQMGDRRRVGLFKALGWTSRDIVALQMIKALLVGGPAIAAGLVGAYALVYALPSGWVGLFFLGWHPSGPILPLEAGHAGPLFLEITGLLLMPFLAAALFSSLRLSAADPQDLLQRGP